MQKLNSCVLFAMKRLILILSLIVICSLICTNKSFTSNAINRSFILQLPCNRLPQTFKSYNQALTLIKSSKFKISESVNTSKSSWIRGASYYSCDKITGFLIVVTDEKEYIHKNVPLEIWNQFKNANSFGSYYSQNIKGRYRLTIN